MIGYLDIGINGFIDSIRFDEFSGVDVELCLQNLEHFLGYQY